MVIDGAFVIMWSDALLALYQNVSPGDIFFKAEIKIDICVGESILIVNRRCGPCVCMCVLVLGCV